MGVTRRPERPRACQPPNDSATSTTRGSSGDGFRRLNASPLGWTECTCCSTTATGTTRHAMRCRRLSCWERGEANTESRTTRPLGVVPHHPRLSGMGSRSLGPIWTHLTRKGPLPSGKRSLGRSVLADRYQPEADIGGFRMPLSR
jgi:hypothetical protein